jgi:hypothetical protein
MLWMPQDEVKLKFMTPALLLMSEMQEFPHSGRLEVRGGQWVSAKETSWQLLCEYMFFLLFALSCLYSSVVVSLSWMFLHRTFYSGSAG